MDVAREGEIMLNRFKVFSDDELKELSNGLGQAINEGMVINSITSDNLSDEIDAEMELRIKLRNQTHEQ